MKTMPVSLLLCLNNFLLFNHILPGERTKIDVSSPFWTNGGLGELAMGKNPSHLISSWPVCMVEGKERNTNYCSWTKSSEPLGVWTRSGPNEIVPFKKCQMDATVHFCHEEILSFVNFQVEQVKSFQKACKHLDNLHYLSGLQEWHQPSPDLWDPSGEELLWGQLSFCFSEVVV